MFMIDAQVQAYERGCPGRPWAAVLHGPPEVTGDSMVTALDAVGWMARCWFRRGLRADTTPATPWLFTLRILADLR